MTATTWKNRHLCLESDVEHLSADDIGRCAERRAALSYDCLTEHGLAACVAAHAHECSVKFLGEIFACRLAYYKTGLCLEGNYIKVKIVASGQAVEILGGKGNLLSCRNFDILVLVLSVGSGSHTPVALVILHEHTNRDSLAALVLKRYIEKFARILKVRVHCRRQFGELGFNRNVDRKVYSGVVDNNIVILPLAIILH